MTSEICKRTKRIILDHKENILTWTLRLQLYTCLLIKEILLTSVELKEIHRQNIILLVPRMGCALFQRKVKSYTFIPFSSSHQSSPTLFVWFSLLTGILPVSAVPLQCSECFHPVSCCWSGNSLLAITLGETVTGFCDGVQRNPYHWIHIWGSYRSGPSQTGDPSPQWWGLLFQEVQPLIS